MKRISYNHHQKGAAIVVVIVVIAIMMILSVSFLGSSSYTYVFTKILGDADTTFFAAETVSNRWFSIIKDTIDHNKFYGIQNQPLQVGGEVAFVDAFLSTISTDFDTKRLKEIKVNGDVGKQYTCTFGRFEIRKCVRDINANNENVVRATVGILSTSYGSLKDSPSVTISSNKRLYFEDVIEIPFFLPMKLSSAVVAIGDVIAIGPANGIGPAIKDAKIIGDINAFGTFPIKTITPKQYFFGGIMAVKNAKLNIFGNVYSRSNVRAGTYADPVTSAKIEDASEINVSKDIIAQGIQTFSQYSKIYGYRNAYTLDDIEINGEDSIIGINRSFIGLSDNPAASNHDENSCILNSSSLHYSLEGASRSRVVVNGDVVMGGAGWKIKSDGTGEFEIESGGLIYPENNLALGSSTNIPTYKYIDMIKNLSGILPTDTTTSLSDPYVKFLKNDAIKKFGYVNVIQGHLPIALGGFSEGAIPMNLTTGIGQWKNEINKLIPVYVAPPQPSASYGNQWSAYFRQNNPIYGITGSTIVGANNAIYWDNQYSSDTVNWSLKKGSIGKLSGNLTNNYQLDGFTASDIAKAYAGTDGTNTFPLQIYGANQDSLEEVYGTLMSQIKPASDRFWKYYWFDKDIVDWSTYNAYTKTPASSAYLATASKSAYNSVMKKEEGAGMWDPGFKSHLTNLKELILNKLNSVATRNYPPLGSTSWEYKTSNVIDETIGKIEGLKTSMGSAPAANNIIIIEEDLSKTVIQSININTKVALPNSIAQPYLILCKDPNVDLIVSNTFYGILFTKGRVRIQRDGKVMGSVIATGRYWNDNHKSTADKDIPTNKYYLNALDSNDMSKIQPLNDGNYAAIILETASAGTNPPTIDFYMGQSDNPSYGFYKLNNTYSCWIGREELLNVFKNKGILLYQIF